MNSLRGFLVLTLLATLSASTRLSALPPQSNHGLMRAVPAPGEVVIDGDLKEWDRSAVMFVYPVRALRERYSVRVHAMWDANALYLGLAWRDPTPMLNKVNAEAAPHEGWMSDCFQGRFVTDKPIHLTAWYGSASKKSVAVFDYHNAAHPQPRKTFRGDGLKLADPNGLQQAFRLDADGRGYTQEMRIPWAMLYEKPAPKAGLKFRFTGEYFWGGPMATQWPAVMWADPVDQKNPVRIVLYQSPQAWGEMELLAKGHLPAPPADDEDDSRLQGPIPIRLEVPQDAVHVSVTIDDAQGRRVRNLLSHGKVADYLVNSPDKKRIIEVPWDGRIDGPWDKNRQAFLGDVAPVGEYRVRAVVHRGLGVTYAGSFYSPGRPAWETADTSGAWGFDHTNPSAVAVLPATSMGKARVFLGWPHGECGTGLIALDDNGLKLWGWNRRGLGAHHLATNTSTLFAIHSDGKFLSAFQPENGQQKPFANGVLDLPLSAHGDALAANDKHVAIASTKANKVLFLDPTTGAAQREVAVEAPGSLAFLPNGTLRGLCGKGLFDIAAGADKAEVRALTGVKQPRCVAADDKGRFFVSDAADQTVKVFDAAGQLAGSIGEAGGHRPGPWQSQRLNTPVALAVQTTAAGPRLWAVEEGLSPRRISVWGDDGKLVRDFIGGTRYSGSGGLLSDDDPSLGIVDGVLFRLDLAKHTYQPLEVMGGAPDPKPGQHALFAVNQLGIANSFGNGNHFISEASGKPVAYFVEGAGKICAVFMKRGTRWLCVAALGRADAFQWPKEFPKPPKPHAIWAWNDLNGDGYQSPDEVTWHDPGRTSVLQHRSWGYRCGKDLTFRHSGLAFAPVRFTADGAPVYDPSKAEKLPGELGELPTEEVYKTRFGYLAELHAADKYEPVDRNNVVHGLGLYTGFDAKGRKVWSFPNYWRNVHGAMTAPIAQPGVVMGALKVTGIFPLTADGKDTGHDVVAIRGNIGQEFLIRDDGLYLGELFTDQRMAPSSLPAERDPVKLLGVPINDTTLGGEPFNGWMGRQSDGKVRMTYGYTDVRIAEVVGLDSVRDLPVATVRLDAAGVAKAKTFVPRATAADGPKDWTIPRGPAFGLDPAALKDAKAISIRSGREEVGKAWLHYDDKNLYLAVQAFDATPLKNTGTDPITAFKTGDGVDLFMAADGATSGGTRVLMTVQNGKAVAVVYRPEGPGDKPFVFKSPVRELSFRYAAVEPSVTVAAQAFGPPAMPRDSMLTATIPWTVLGITPKSGLVLKGDVGLLLSDDTGTTTAQRVRWSDRETNVVNDLPTEAEFSPKRWGTLRLK